MPWILLSLFAVGVEPNPIPGFVGVQVNVDPCGNNIPGDAANEPTIAIDPTDTDSIVIVWRQFDTIESDFRTAGWGVSRDRGVTWQFRGVIHKNIEGTELFSSDPVLATTANGDLFHIAVPGRLTKSEDFGDTWAATTPISIGDKPWIAIDTTGGPANGAIYINYWDFSQGFILSRLARSFDGGATIECDINVPGSNRFGTSAVGADGTLFIAGWGSQSGNVFLEISTNVGNPDEDPVFWDTHDLIGGSLPVGIAGSPNPGGLLGQPWVVLDTTGGEHDGNIYVLATTYSSSTGLTRVRLVRSQDGGTEWLTMPSPAGDTDSWQWFGTISVAPNGRLDVVWNDTRNTGVPSLSEVFYASSSDAGDTWSEPVAITPVFDSWAGWPQQEKIGDYYHMISDESGVNLAYAATFNDEQDVYFMRIGPSDCNGNGAVDYEEILAGDAQDCDENGIPDECDPDADQDGVINGCDDDIDGDGVPNDEDACDCTLEGIPIGKNGEPRGDWNLTCAVDLLDFAHFQPCFESGGPGIPHPVAGCQLLFDYDYDSDIDLADFRAFQAVFDP